MPIGSIKRVKLNRLAGCYVQDRCVGVVPAVMALRTLVNIISSTPRVFVSGCGKARFAGNSGAIAKKCNAAAAAHEQPNVEIILTRVLRSALALKRPL